MSSGGADLGFWLSGYQAHASSPPPLFTDDRSHDVLQNTSYEGHDAERSRQTGPFGSYVADGGVASTRPCDNCKHAVYQTVKDFFDRYPQDLNLDLQPNPFVVKLIGEADVPNVPPPCVQSGIRYWLEVSCYPEPSHTTSLDLKTWCEEGVKVIAPPVIEYVPGQQNLYPATFSIDTQQHPKAKQRQLYRMSQLRWKPMRGSITWRSQMVTVVTQATATKQNKAAEQSRGKT